MNAWDKRESESDEAYVRFLIYRNLGPSRSIERAAIVAFSTIETKRKKTKPSTSQWEKDSATHEWRQRAVAWDIAQLSQLPAETTTIILEAIKEFARKTLHAASGDDYHPKGREVRENILVIAALVSPEIITQAVVHSGDDTRQASAVELAEQHLAERIPQP